MISLNILNIKHAIPRDELKPISILFISVLILAVHKTFGSIPFAQQIFSGTSEYGAVIYMFLSTFILLGLAPLFLINLGFKESITNYGLIIGDWKTGLKIIAVLFPVISLFVLYPSIYNQEMVNFYPQSKEAAGSIKLLLKFEAIRILFFYTGWEIFFRGFMLFGLRKYVGDAMAICIQIIPSCLWHIGMPAGEIFASIFGGILFGMMALKTGSILYPYILHCLIGLTLDLFIVLNM
jgi:membrane protease YdiL (CAAX protease family)